MRIPVKKRALLALLVPLLVACASSANSQTNSSNDVALTNTDQPIEQERAAPRYLLLGSHGRSVTSEDFRDRFQLVAFGFTSCPDVCPTTMVEMQQVLAALGPRAKHLQPVFITVDPQRDTTVVLAAYTRNFDERILGLTGSPELVRWAANNFKVQFTKVQEPGAGANIYTIDHSAGMFLLGPDGQLLSKIAYGTAVRDVVARIEHWLEADGK